MLNKDNIRGQWQKNNNFMQFTSSIHRQNAQKAVVLQPVPVY